MRTQQHAEPETLRFRGATLDEAIELAEQSLGTRTRVVAANHIRRGGIGGFFASDLGVEVSVVLDDETIEAALDRIVEETAVQEREKWRDRAKPQLEHIDGAAPAPTDIPRASSFAAALQRVDESLVEHAAAAPTPAPTPAPVTTAPAPTPAALPATQVPVAAATSTSLGSRMERLEAAFASLRAGDAPVAAPTRTTVAAPTRRQVELAVAAADQLIDSIVRRGDTDRLCVRVVMRASTGAEIEAEAHWGSTGEAR